MKLILIKNKYSGFNFEPDDTVVIIDIFRASSTIVTAMANGAKEIIPCVEIEQVLQLKSKNNEIMGAGERNGEKIPDFEYDNSPTSFNNNKIFGKTIALSTTNCTKAIDIAKSSENVLISCFLNISATIDTIKQNYNRIKRLVLLCAGNNEEESEEDNMYAAELISRLVSQVELDLDWQAKQQLEYRNTIVNLSEYYMNTAHSQRLIELGKRKDIDFSLKFDKFGCVPIYANGSIKKK